jgi:DNA-binding CsgD family transcriptional regulator
LKNQLSQDHFILFFLLLVVLASTADLVADLREGVNVSHLVQEGVILVTAISIMAWVVSSLRRRNREVSELHAELDALKNTDQPQPREIVEAKHQLAAAMATQFDAWSLTKSEREVGLLLLKGFSLKEISTLRGTSERTIRQQASSIYQKAGLNGRHALSAWFIEDIL